MVFHRSGKKIPVSICYSITEIYGKKAITFCFRRMAQRYHEKKIAVKEKSGLIERART
ncbi:MAG: hypothetical protein AB1480_15710 [Nitrospirota bacterium]